MTDDHAMIIPLMAAALIADGASRLLSKHGLYHSLARNFMPAANGHEAGIPRDGSKLDAPSN
jgi:H+/Cl- antiporter ClcA